MSHQPTCPMYCRNNQIPENDSGFLSPIRYGQETKPSPLHMPLALPTHLDNSSTQKVLHHQLPLPKAHNPMAYDYNTSHNPKVFYHNYPSFQDQPLELDMLKILAEWVIYPKEFAEGYDIDII